MLTSYPQVRLKDVLRVHYGEALKAEDRDESGKFAVFGSNGEIGRHSAAVVEYPTLVVGRKGSVGAVTFAPDGGWPIDTAFYVELLDPAHVNLRYLFYALRHVRLERHTISTTIPGLSREDIYRTKIPLPPVAEQRHIAEVLDKADILCANRRRAVAKLDLLTQSLFHEMFIKQPTVAGTTIVRLAEVATRVTDGTHLTPKFVSAGVPFIFVKNVRNGEIDFRTDKYITKEDHRELSRRCPIESGDILYTTVGATYGQAAVVGSFTEFAFQRHLAHIKTDTTKVLPAYLGTLMQLPLVKKQADRWARGAAQPTINLKELRDFEILLPPMELQRAFVSRARTVDCLKAAQLRSLTKLDALFGALRHGAFFN